MDRAGPVLPAERLDELDFIRGIALIGILTVNMSMFSTPYFYAEMLGLKLWDAAGDQWVQYLIDVLAQGKFYTMFSFLFGFGAVLFLQKAANKTVSASKLFTRRMLSLLLFGLLHMIGLWYGDILVSYSLAGLLWLAFAASRARTLVIWGISLLTTYLSFMALLVWASSSMPQSSDNSMTSWIRDRYQDSFEVYANGTYQEIVSFRLEDLLFLFTNSVLVTLFFVFPMILFGAAAALRREAFFNALKNQLRLVLGCTLLIGAVFTWLKEWSAERINTNRVTLYDGWNTLGMMVGDIALCFFYIALFYTIYQMTKRSSLSKGVCRLGRMAFSNYLMQSFICTTLFYGYGFGWYGEVGAMAGIALTFVIIVGQISLSYVWLNRFRFGPLEWLWRWFTYGKGIEHQ